MQAGRLDLLSCVMALALLRVVQSRVHARTEHLLLTAAKQALMSSQVLRERGRFVAIE